MRTLLAVFFFLFSLSLFSQDYYNKDSSRASKKEPDSVASSKVYLGISTGLNSDVGLFGFVGKVRLKNTFFLLAAAGIGSWGTKLSIGAKHERKNTKCWGYSLSYSRSSGLKDFTIELETVDSIGKPPVTKEVNMDLLPAGTLNLAASYNWYFRKNKLFYLEFGYALPLVLDPYRIKDGSELTEESKIALRIIQPGGVLFGVGFMFGL